MTLKNIIIHSIIKDAEHPEAILDLSIDCVNNDTVSLDFIQNLHDRVKDKYTYGVFNTQNPPPFPKLFTTYLELRNKESFLNISQNSLVDLKTRLDSSNFSRGGFIIFSDYTLNGNDYLGIFLIRRTSGIDISKEGNSYTLNAMNRVDTDKISMGVRINVTEYQSITNNRYLLFSRNQLPDISQFFLNWISIDRREDDIQVTTDLLSIIRNIETPKDENDTPLERSDFSQLVLDYAHSRPEKSINLKEMSQHFYGDDNKISKYCDDNKIQINEVFRPNFTVLRRLKYLNVSADGIKLTLNLTDFDTKIEIDNEIDEVKIKSKSFKEKLIKLRSEALSDGGQQ